MFQATFNQYRKNIHSQNGEDGVIAEILSRLGISKGSFAEFGAWDGKYLSNTYTLLEQGWQGVYIEGDPKKFEDLVRNMVQFKQQVDLVEAMVAIDGNQCLDELLTGTRLDKNFEVLSIDIDSYDWYVWHSLREFAPLIVVIEINSFLPVGIFQTHRDHEVPLSSFSSTLALAKNKGYTLVCHTGNMIFVKDELIATLELKPAELDHPELLFDYTWIKHRQRRKKKT